MALHYALGSGLSVGEWAVGEQVGIAAVTKREIDGGSEHWLRGILLQ